MAMTQGRPPSAGFRRTAGLTCLILILMLNLLGCKHIQVVTPLPNREVAVLNGADIVRIMKRAGFSDDQMIELGPDLRNCLALQGAGQIRLGDKVEALFAVQYPYVHVCSRQRGRFIYNVKTKQIRLVHSRSSLFDRLANDL